MIKDDEKKLMETEGESLHVALKKELIKRIDSGDLAAGCKLKGERRLAEEYGVSRWTVTEALKQLEQDGYVERIACRGVFVKQQEDKAEKELNVVYAFHEAEISEEKLGFAGWQRHSEIYAGLMAGVQKYGINLQLKNPDMSDIDKVVERYSKADGVIFYETVHEELITRLSALGVTCVIIYPTQNVMGFNSISYDRDAAISETADYIASSGCKSAGFLVTESDNDKGARIKLQLELKGVETSADWIYALDPYDVNSTFNYLKESLPVDHSELPDVLFCDRMIFPMSLLRVIHSRNWELGKDVKVMAYTCRSAIKHICPELTYMRIPYYEIGREACALMRRRFQTGDGQIEHIKIKPELVINSSM